MSHVTRSRRQPVFEKSTARQRNSQPPRDERPRVTLATALRRYPMVVLLPVIVLVAAGVTLGVRRHETFTASTQLNVGTPDASSNATPGQTSAAQQLASSYSLQATSAQIYAAVARTLKLSRPAVSASLSTDTVPNSSTFYINAKAPSSAQAIAISVTASRALQRAVSASNSSDGPGHVLGIYRGLQRQANALSDAVNRLKAHHAPTSEVDNAQLAFQTAELRAQAQAGRYNTAVAEAVNPNLDILNPARSASSDRRTYVERYGIVGVAAGLVIGAALAFLVALLRARRRPRWA